MEQPCAAAKFFSFNIIQCPSVKDSRIRVLTTICPISNLEIFYGFFLAIEFNYREKLNSNSIKSW